MPPAVPEASDSDDLSPLARGVLGDYRVLREIGRGGMGVVYEAEQISLGRRVALKVLPFAAVLDSSKLQRFRTEARASARLHHQNIVPVYSVGTERGVHYYAMQYIEGETLASVIRELRRLESRSKTGRRAAPLSEATSELHAAGPAPKARSSRRERRAIRAPDRWPPCPPEARRAPATSAPSPISASRRHSRSSTRTTRA